MLIRVTGSVLASSIESPVYRYGNQAEGSDRHEPEHDDVGGVPIVGHMDVQP